jgi:hypothetical protein
VATPAAPYVDFVGAFAISGFGMALSFPPVANVILSAVRPNEEGQACGANNAIRRCLSQRQMTHGSPDVPGGEFPHGLMVVTGILGSCRPMSRRICESPYPHD